MVRKRLFLRAVKEAGFQDVGLGDLEGSIAVLFNAEDEMAPLKVVNKYAKILAKDQSGSLKFL
ncbi:MAG: 50S ribosomal protein L10 [bacterium]|nr:50S ribosomal protein L10 [bacterium]